MLVFFAGSARYLLPVAAPLAILAANASRLNIALAGAALQLRSRARLGVVNYQHWNTYRHYVEILKRQTQGRRVWVNADWGLRYYLEAAGGLPLTKDPHGSARRHRRHQRSLRILCLAGVPLTPFYQIEIRPWLPLRLISLDGRSAYSFGSHGLLPFEISTAPIDRVRAEIAVAPELSYLDPQDPKAAAQFISGISADGWTAKDATVLLKVPRHPARLSASIYVPRILPRATLPSPRMAAFWRKGNFPKATPSTASPLPRRPPPEASPSRCPSIKHFRSLAMRADLGVVLTGIGFQ